ncbi:MAG TPA: lysylphosphatidylglycerol synthase transmembrane domain-containing protein [Ilumatobacteraceae bacterium]|nr:lysylphosphatidylglycerol synthase transmembrane domain-containing protein [Ilumatobacteraceae bacterium]
MNRSRLANLIGIAIGVAGIAFVTSRIIRDREAIADALSSAELGWLLVGAVAGCIAMALIGVNWLLILRHGGAAAPWRRGMAWFFVGQLGKYVPGGIWPIVGQAELAHREATPRGAAYSSTAMSMVTTFLGSATVAAITGLMTPTDHRAIAATFAAVLLLLFVAIASPPARRFMDRLARRVTTRELRLPDARWFALVVARHLPVWVAFAGMNIFAAVALGVELDESVVIELVFATCISWMAGFVIVGVPGGIGVRETIFISMTTAMLGADIAVSVAVLSRVVSIAVDLLGAAMSVAVARTAPAPGPAGDRADEVTLDRYAAP